MMYFVIKQPTPAQHYNNSSRVKQHFQVLLVQEKLLPYFTGPDTFSTGPQRNIPGTIFYDVIAVTLLTVVCHTCIMNLSKRLLDIRHLSNQTSC